MTSGYILIGTMLILGGIIAVSGDRIGTRVGKARLTLFKLRPRQTATLVTILTGTLISASVLILIFGASEQLRTGVFDLQKIQRKLSDTKENLARALEQKDRVQRELEIARNEQSEAQDLLTGINKSFKAELLKQSIAAQNFKNTQQQLEAVSNQRNQLVTQVTTISRQRRDLQAKQQAISTQIQALKQRLSGLESDILPLQWQLATITSQRSQLQQQLESPPESLPQRIESEPNLIAKTQRLQTYQNTAKRIGRNLEQATVRLTNTEAELQAQQTALLDVENQVVQIDLQLAIRQAQLKEKDKQHQKLEREFQTRAMQLKLRDRQLKKIETQLKTKRQGLDSLEQEVNNIEQEYRKIRQGNIGILRNQVLASTMLKVSNTETATKAINALLVQANLNALHATNPDVPNPQGQVIDITATQLTQLKQQIADRQNYVVRVFSTGNYVMGDKNIQVFIDATPNQKLFDRNAKVAAVNIDPIAMNESQIRQQLNILLVTSQLRAKRAGILDDRPQVGDGQLTTYVRFLERVKTQKYPIEIAAIVDRDTYTLGPLVIKLQAISNGKVLFSTYSNAAIN